MEVAGGLAIIILIGGLLMLYKGISAFGDSRLSSDRQGNTTLGIQDKASLIHQISKGKIFIENIKRNIERANPRGGSNIKVKTAL